MRPKINLIVAFLFLASFGLSWPAMASQSRQGARRVAPDPLRELAPLQDRAPGPASHTPSDGLRSSAAASNNVTLPSDFPAITVTTAASNTAPGLVFAAPFSVAGGTSSYLLILDNSGQPVYYQRLPTGDEGIDFKMLPDGTLSYFDNSHADWVIMDSSYHEIGTVKPGNDVGPADAHELQLVTQNGHYLIMADQFETVDMSKVVQGGNPQAVVEGQVIQEVDMTGTVYFNWPILQHVPITDSNQSLTTPTIDYSHCNAIDIDSDGNLLLSCRHLSAIIKINRSTGDIMWHLGGVDNNFSFARGSGVSAAEPLNFYYQHDIRRIPNGDITLFDNHDNNSPQVSRALEYTLDEQPQQMGATLVRAQHHSPDTYSMAMGDAQLLPNGNWMVGWGDNPALALTEYHPDGSEAFEIVFNSALVSYRAFRFPWTGHPTWPPALVLQPSAPGIKLTFSWNGATDVASYRIYGGNTSPPTQLLEEQPKSEFETSVQLNGARAVCGFYKVVPIDTSGQAGQPSLTVPNSAGNNSSCSRVLLPFVAR